MNLFAIFGIFLGFANLVKAFKDDIGACTCTPGSSPPICASDHTTWTNYCNNLDLCLKKKDAFKIHDGPCVITDLGEARKRIGACTCTPGSSKPVCTNHGTLDNYCNNLNYCLELKEIALLHEGPCTQLLSSSDDGIGACTCTPGSSPPICASDHMTWTSYCNNLDLCLKKKGAFKIHDGPCVIFDIKKARGDLGACSCAPRSSKPVCTDHGTIDDYCNNLNHCLELNEFAFLHEGPCKELLSSSDDGIGACTCTPGSSPPICASDHTTWTNYCNNLDLCLKKKGAFKIHDGPCVITDLGEARKRIGACTCTPGSSKPVCTNHGTLDNYCNNLNHCLELNEFEFLHEGPCKELLSSSDDGIGACTCTPGSSPPICASDHTTWTNYCNNLDLCLKKKGAFKIHDGPCVITDLKEAEDRVGACTCTPGSSKPVCTDHGTLDNYCDNLNFCLELSEYAFLYEGPCKSNRPKRPKGPKKSRDRRCACPPGSSPKVCVSSHETWDNYCNNLELCLRKAGVKKLHDGPCHWNN